MVGLRDNMPKPAPLDRGGKAVVTLKREDVSNRVLSLLPKLRVGQPVDVLNVPVFEARTAAAPGAAA
jgi:hypothetical protein